MFVIRNRKEEMFAWVKRLFDRIFEGKHQATFMEGRVCGNCGRRIHRACSVGTLKKVEKYLCHDCIGMPEYLECLRASGGDSDMWKDMGFAVMGVNNETDQKPYTKDQLARRKQYKEIVLEGLKKHDILDKQYMSRVYVAWHNKEINKVDFVMADVFALGEIDAEDFCNSDLEQLGEEPKVVAVLEVDDRDREFIDKGWMIIGLHTGGRYKANKFEE